MGFCEYLPNVTDEQRRADARKLRRRSEGGSFEEAEPSGSRVKGKAEPSGLRVKGKAEPSGLRVKGKAEPSGLRVKGKAEPSAFQ